MSTIGGQVGGQNLINLVKERSLAVNKILLDFIYLQVTRPSNYSNELIGSTLILSGGAKQRYRYANDPSKVFTLNVSDSTSGWRDDKIPEMLGNRMWHGCTLANIDNEVSNVFFIASASDQTRHEIPNLFVLIFVVAISKKKRQHGPSSLFESRQKQ